MQRKKNAWRSWLELTFTLKKTTHLQKMKKKCVKMGLKKKKKSKRVVATRVTAIRKNPKADWMFQA